MATLADAGTAARRAAAHSLLCLCLSDEEDARVAKRFAEATADAGFPWSEFIDLATDQLVAPAVTWRLRRCDAEDAVPDLVRRYFDAQYRLNRIRNTQLREQAIAVAGALNDIDVVPVFLKGSAGLLTGLYADPALRVMSDIDALVPKQRGDDCVKRLGEIGYTVVPMMKHPRGYSVAKLADKARRTALDLHHDALAYPDKGLLPAKRVLENAVQHETRGIRFAVPCTRHMAVISIGHAQLKDHCAAYGHLPLRSLFDLATLLDAPGAPLDWSEVETTFAHGRGQRALDVHREAARVLLGTSPGDAHRSSFRARLALRYGQYMTRRPGLHQRAIRATRVWLLLTQELSAADLRRRLARNLVTRAWWRRNLRLLSGRKPRRQG